MSYFVNMFIIYTCSLFVMTRIWTRLNNNFPRTGFFYFILNVFNSNCFSWFQKYYNFLSDHARLDIIDIVREIFTRNSFAFTRAYYCWRSVWFFSETCRIRTWRKRAGTLRSFTYLFFFLLLLLLIFYVAHVNTFDNTPWARASELRDRTVVVNTFDTERQTFFFFVMDNINV